MNSREDLLLTSGCDLLLSEVNGRDDDVTLDGRSGAQSVTFFNDLAMPDLQLSPSEAVHLAYMQDSPSPDYVNGQYETGLIGSHFYGDNSGYTWVEEDSFPGWHEDELDAVGASDGGGAGGEEMEREQLHSSVARDFHSPAFQPLESHPSVQRAGYIPDAGAPLACSYCKERFWTKASLERHLAMRHGLITSELHAKAEAKKDGGRCERCRKVYGFGLLRHLETAHEMQLRVTDITYSCGLCPSTTCSSYQRLEAHLSQMHPDVATGAPATSAPTGGENAEGVQYMQCDDGRDSESEDVIRRAAADIEELASGEGAVDVPDNDHLMYEQCNIAKHNQAASDNQKRLPRGGKSTDSSLAKRPKQGGGRKGHNEGASGSKKMRFYEQEGDVEAGGDQFECEDGLMLITDADIRQRVIDNRAQVQVVPHLGQTLDIEYENKRFTVDTGMHPDWLGYKPNLHHAKTLGLIDNHTLIHCVNGRTEMRSDWTGKKSPIHGVNGHSAPDRNSDEEYATLLVAGPLRGHRKCLKYFAKTPKEIMVRNKEGNWNKMYQCPGIDVKTGELCSDDPMTMSNLINHHKSVHTLRYTHYCKACGEGMTKLSYMENHVYGGHFGLKKEVKCDHCEKKFYFDYEYDNHKCKGHEPVGGGKAVVQKHGPGGASSGGRGGHGSGRGKGGGRGRGGARGKGGARVGIETAV